MLGGKGVLGIPGMYSRLTELGTAWTDVRIGCFFTFSSRGSGGIADNWCRALTTANHRSWLVDGSVGGINVPAAPFFGLIASNGITGEWGYDTFPGLGMQLGFSGATSPGGNIIGAAMASNQSGPSCLLGPGGGIFHGSALTVNPGRGSSALYGQPGWKFPQAGQGFGFLGLRYVYDSVAHTMGLYYANDSPFVLDAGNVKATFFAQIENQVYTWLGSQAWSITLPSLIYVQGGLLANVALGGSNPYYAMMDLAAVGSDNPAGAPTLVTQPAVSGSIRADSVQTGTLTAAAAGSGLSYQWQVNSDSFIVNGTNLNWSGVGTWTNLADGPLTDNYGNILTFSGVGDHSTLSITTTHCNSGQLWVRCVISNSSGAIATAPSYVHIDFRGN
jgi:hypothetical protein